MAAETQSPEIIEVCQVTPAADPFKSSSGLAQLCRPLTFFQTRYLLGYPQGALLFFYRLNARESTPAVFHSQIVPKLKHSLSQTLLHFLPLAGSIRWPPNSPKPMIVYAPGDSVSLIVAEDRKENRHFDRLVGSGTFLEGSEIYPYTAELLVSDFKASALALQITLFPREGFCIYVAQHHGVGDGKSLTMFLKAWTYVTKHGSPILPPELTPSLDITVIKDSYGLEAMYLDYWQATRRSSATKKGPNYNPKSLRWIFPSSSNAAGSPSKMVRATFQLSSESIDNLKKSVLSYHHNQATELHLSSFILAFAYVSVCLVKARGGSKDRKVLCMLTVDCRGRFGLGIPQNYFGVCLGRKDTVMEAGHIMEDNGVAIMAKRLSDMVKGLDKKGIFLGEKGMLERWGTLGSEVQKLRVSGSNRFGMYGLDFGWGRPERIMIPSIDTTDTFSLLESKEAGGGMEVGLLLPKLEMDTFASLFAQGLRDSNMVQSRL